MTAEPMHLMTIEMGAWCGASGPGNGRASSQWRDVTCPDCTAKGTAWLRSLVWDMLGTMGPGRESLAFAVRAGRLGVTDEQGRPLAMACAGDRPPAAAGARAGTILSGDAAELATLRALHRAVGYFGDTWAELLRDLPDSYGCHMNCAEANAAADLYRALNDDATADAIIAAHAEHDDEEDLPAHREDGDGP